MNEDLRKGKKKLKYMRSRSLHKKYMNNNIVGRKITKKHVRNLNTMRRGCRSRSLNSKTSKVAVSPSSIDHR